MEKRKRKKRILTLSIVIIVIAVLIFPMYLKISNYEENKQAYLSFDGYNEDGYITNQTLVSVFDYGVTPANLTGCGFIATFNALTYLNKEGCYDKEINLAKIIRFYDGGGALMYSTLGTNPVAIVTYFKLKGFNVSLSLKKENFEESINNNKVSIICYVDKQLKYGHYQMVHSNENIEEVTFYNPRYTRTIESYVDARNDDYMFLISIK